MPSITICAPITANIGPLSRLTTMIAFLPRTRVSRRLWVKHMYDNTQITSNGDGTKLPVSTNAATLPIARS